MSTAKVFSLPSLLSSRKKEGEEIMRVIKDQSVQNYHASFPTESRLQQSFRDAFVINKPVDSVGGDGYWACEMGDFAFLVVFDCAGHGRLASMMTRFYIRIIHNEIIGRKQSDPGDILTGIHSRLKDEFSNNVSMQNSSADMGVLVFNKKLRKLYYSGAHMDLVYSEEGSVDRIRGAKRAVGDLFEVDRTYTAVSFQVPKNENSSYYLFSDGALDLLGGAQNKRLGYKGLVSLIQQHASNRLHLQKAMLLHDFNRYLGANDQLDDLLVIGVRF